MSLRRVSPPPAMRMNGQSADVRRDPMGLVRVENTYDRGRQRQGHPNASDHRVIIIAGHFAPPLVSNYDKATAQGDPIHFRTARRDGGLITRRGFLAKRSSTTVKFEVTWGPILPPGEKMSLFQSEAAKTALLVRSLKNDFIPQRLAQSANAPANSTVRLLCRRRSARLSRKHTGPSHL